MLQTLLADIVATPRAALSAPAAGSRSIERQAAEAAVAEHHAESTHAEYSAEEKRVSAKELPGRHGDDESGAEESSGARSTAQDSAGAGSRAAATAPAPATTPEAALLATSLALQSELPWEPGVEIKSDSTRGIEDGLASIAAAVTPGPPTETQRDDASPAAAAAQTPPGSATSAPDAGGAAATRLVDRGLNVLLTQRGGSLILRLLPPELGALRVEMKIESGRVDVLFQPAGPEARQLLQGNLDMLRQSLQRHGLSVGRLAVEPAVSQRTMEMGRSETESMFDAAGRQSQGRQEAERELARRTAPGPDFELPLRPAA